MTDSSTVATRTGRPLGTLTNAMWGSGYVVSAMALSFVVTPVLIHQLGKSDYGLLLLIWSVGTILGTLNLGFGEATLRYIARSATHQDMIGINRVFGAVLLLFVVICALMLIGMFAGARYVAEWLNTPADQVHLVAWLLRLSAISISCTIIISAFGSVPLALNRFDINSKIQMGSNVIRSCGYISMAALGADLVTLILWDLLISLVVLCLFVKASRGLLPQLKLLPPLSFRGLREVIGYSVFSFLTSFLYRWHRESGKLMLARFLGPVPVGFLGAPDNLAQRFHDIIAGGVEATLPRFSAETRTGEVERFYWFATWTGLAASIVVFVPFMVFVPDFMSLWISPEFALQSGLIGQLLAAYLISNGGFAAPAAYFRGTGRPGVVTFVVLLSLIITVIAGCMLIPRHGAVGAAYAYLAGSIAPFLGMTAGSIFAFGSKAIPKMLQTVGGTLASGAVSFIMCLSIRQEFGELTWPLFLLLGAASLLGTAGLVFGVDSIIGGARPPSVHLIGRITERMRRKTSVMAGSSV